jgi:PhnB protein
MAAFNFYLNFPGTTEEAFNFYKSIFGGEFVFIQRFKDTPAVGNLPSEVGNMIMHIALPVGNGNMLMATDAIESMGHKVEYGNNTHISISPDSEEETKKLFDALSAGGKITMPLDKQFWNAYFGACVDKYGISWMVNYDYNKK